MEYNKITKRLDAALNVGRSFDVTKREFLAARGSLSASFYTVAGLCDSEAAEKLIHFAVLADCAEQCYASLPHPDVMLTDDPAVLSSAVLSGRGVLVIEGADRAAVIDIKSYPLRSVCEPENDKVLRGPRDGFGESLVRNTALIRRRLRDPKLIIERFTVGDPAGCDIALCYVDGKASERLVSLLRKRLSSLKTESLNMSQQSLAECLITTRRFDPFPKIRYTERPDTAAAMLEEGSVTVVCDNSPQVMLLPTSIFDFLQETDDYYFPPLVGSYLRITRMMIFLLALILTPLWYLLVKTPDNLPSQLAFININEPAAVPLLLQLLIAEFMIDGLKLASLNTPSMLSNSLSVVGGLILGDYAVQAGWFSPQTILYMAIVSIASFTQQSYELGYAVKFLRIFLLIAVELFGWWGFAVGLAAAVLLIVFNQTVDGSRSYLYPLIPFNGKALSRLLLRRRK